MNLYGNIKLKINRFLIRKYSEWDLNLLVSGTSCDSSYNGLTQIPTRFYLTSVVTRATF